MRSACKKTNKTAYHLPGSPIPNNQFLVFFYDSRTKEVDQKRDPGAADPRVSRNLGTAAQVQWKDFLDGHLVR